LAALSTMACAQIRYADADATRQTTADADRINPTARTPFALAGDQAAREQQIVDLGKVVRAYMNLAPGSFGAHPSAASFPGVVDPRITERQDVTLTLSPNEPRWQTTGFYANAGEVVTVRFPDGAPAGVGKITIHIGCHRDNLLSARQTQWKRFPLLTRTFPVSSELTKIANAFGGPIFVEFANAPSNAKPIRVSFEHVAREPLFVLGTTTVDQWRSARNDPAPWAELAGAKMILHVPADQIRKLDDPTPLLQWWDQVLTLEDDLVGWPARRSPERVVPDVQISAGWMHSGYPFMCHLASAPMITNLEKLKRDGDWGFFHELGHNHQSGDWTFEGQTEVTVNLFTLYVMEKLVGQRCGEPGTRMSNYRELLAKRFANPPADGPFEQLAPFVVLIRHFGFDALRATLVSYQTDPIDHKLSPASRQAIFVRRYSQNAGHNLAPFFKRMGYSIDEETLQTLAKLPAFDFAAELAGK
jgi:hypothetical protein